jgi:hypothetical protein
MFCSLKVERKNNVDSLALEESSSRLTPVKYRSEWEQVVDNATFEWLKDRPHVSTPRNVGGTRKNKWTPIEDQILNSAVAQFGQDNWRRVAMLVPGRNGKQCRERWFTQMAPDNSKEEWSAREDMLLVEKQSEMGNQWAKIKDFLPGRSIVSVKNRWNWLCRRDIPNHSQEFEEIVRTQLLPDEHQFGDLVADPPLSLPQIESWGDQWSLDFLF